MRRARSLAATLPLIALACSTATNGPASVRLRPSLIGPRTFADAVSSLELSVLAKDGAAACVPETGTVVERETARVVTKAKLKSTCDDGSRFCGDLTVERSPDTRIFIAEGSDAAGKLIAVGCAEAAATEDELALDLVIHRFIPPATCGNDALEATEQCESDDVSCASCKTAEVVLSQSGPAGAEGVVGAAAIGTSGAATTSFVLAHVANIGGSTELVARGLSARAAALPPPLDVPSFLPKATSTTDPPQTKNQGAPAVAIASGRSYVAYEDDGSGSFDVRVRGFDASFTAADDVVVASTSSSERSPAIAAGADGKLFVAWLDEAAHTFRGRLLAPPSTLSAAQDLGSGIETASLGVAARSSGYVAVWQNGPSVLLRLVDANGTPVGASVPVADGDTVAPEPRVASSPNGGFAIAMVLPTPKGHRVVLARYDDDGIAIDAGVVVDDVAKSDASSPAVTALPGGLGYGVFWIEGTEVRGRYVGASGFLSNPITAQDESFQVSTVPGRSRSATLATTGGDGPWVLVGWLDAADGGALVVRRLPPPLLPY